MGNLAAPFDIGVRSPEEVRLAMSNVKIYRGGAVGAVLGTGYAVVYAPGTAGMRFIGLAEETVDNSAGSAGDKYIRVRRAVLAKFTQTGLDVTSVGKTAFLSDDNTLTLVPTGPAIGRIVGIEQNDSAALVDITNGANHVPQERTITFTIPTIAAKTIYDVFVADKPCHVTAVNFVPTVAQGGALTVTPVKAADGSAPAAATTPLVSSGFDGNATAYTQQAGALTATAANLALAAGDRIGVVLSTASTTGQSLLQITIRPD